MAKNQNGKASNNGHGSNGHSNGHAKAALVRAPRGGIRVGGKFYKGGAAMPERYRRMLPTEGDHRDPASGVPLSAPNFGRFVLPHAITFVGKQSTVAHVYRNPDEAVVRSGGQAWKMRRDPAIMECLEARQRATALLNWHLEVEDEKDPRQKQVLDVMTKVLKRTRQFTEYRRCLLEALWYGRYAVQHSFGFKMIDGKRRCYLADWDPINGDKLVFRFDDGSGKYDDKEIGVKVTPVFGQKDVLGGTRRLEVTDLGMAYFFEKWERSLLAIHRHIIEDGDYEDPISAGRIHGVGIRDRIYWCWFQKQETMAQLMEVIDRTGSGITIYWYPHGDAQAKEEVEEMAEKQKHENVLVMPRMSGDPSMDAYGIERIEPNAGGIEAIKGVVDEFFGDQIMRYICGGTLFSKSKALGLGGGASDAQEQSFHLVIQYDAVKLEETITEQLVEPLKAFNLPEARDIPIWFRIDTDSPDSEEKLEAAFKLWQMGAKIKTAEVMGKVGLSMVGPDDEFLQDPQFAMQPQGQPGAMPGQPVADGQPQDQLHDLFGPLADEIGQSGQEGGQEPPGGPAGEEGGGEPPSPFEGGGPAQYARRRQVRSSEGQQALPGLSDANKKRHSLWNENLHPRAGSGAPAGKGGEFVEKPGASLPHQHGQGMLFHELASKLHASESAVEPHAKSIQQGLFQKLAQSDIPPEQLAALLSGDHERMEALRNHAHATGQAELPPLVPESSIESPSVSPEGLSVGPQPPEGDTGGLEQEETPPSPSEPSSEPLAGKPGGSVGSDEGGFSLQQQKVREGAEASKTPDSGGEQKAFFHGLGDKPGQGKLIEGLDLAGPKDGAEEKAKPFDAEKWESDRADRIKASKAAGNIHVDEVRPSVETMRGKTIYNVHDPKERGTVRTVSSDGDVVVHWSDEHSASKNNAPVVTEGKKQVAESWLSPSDLKDYVFDKPTAQPKPKPKKDKERTNGRRSPRNSKSLSHDGAR